MIAHKMRGAATKGRLPAMAAAVLLIFFLQGAAAQLSLGVSPAELVFGDLYVDGYGERILQVSSSSTTPVAVDFSFVGEGEEWLRVEPARFTVSRGKPQEVVVRAETEGASPGNYALYLVAGSSGGGSGKEGAVTVLRQELKMPVKLTISGEQRPACSLAVSVGVAEQFIGVPLHLSVENSGNVRLSPRVIVDIISEQEKLLHSSTFSLPRTLPGKAAMQKKFLPAQLEKGQYWMLLSIPTCGQYTTLPFDVVEERPLTPVVQRLQLPAQLERGEIHPLRVVVENPHERPVQARILVEYVDEEGELGRLESEEMRLAAEEERDVQLYFTPSRSGTYTLRATVESYDASGEPIGASQSVVERETLVSAPARAGLKVSVALGAFALAIMMLFLLIRREQKNSGAHS